MQHSTTKEVTIKTNKPYKDKLSGEQYLQIKSALLLIDKDTFSYQYDIKYIQVESS